MNLPVVLYLAHRVPYPPDKGDRIRTFHILRWLSPRARVHLACLADEPLSGDETTALGRYCERVRIIPLDGRARWLRVAGSLALGRTATEGAFDSPTLRETVRAWTGQTRYHAVLVSASGMASYLAVPGLAGVPTVIDLMDVDSQKWFDYAATSRGLKAWLYGLEGRRLRAEERDLAGRVRALTLVSEAEVALFRSGVTRSGHVEAIPNGVDLSAFQPAPSVAGSGCVFVGALDYRPNVDAACWFCEAVWPEIRRLRPGATLRLVGRRPSLAVRRLAGGLGVEVAGDVPDVRPFLAEAAVVVAPLRIARGVQNKVLEAMAMARPVVVSPEARAGLNAEPGVHLIEARTPDDWVTEIVALLDDPGRRALLGQRARRFVEDNHRWDLCLAPFGDLLEVASSSSLASKVGTEAPSP